MADLPQVAVIIVEPFHLDATQTRPGALLWAKLWASFMVPCAVAA
jgi:hypothetical protein